MTGVARPVPFKLDESSGQAATTGAGTPRWEEDGVLDSLDEGIMLGPRIVLDFVTAEPFRPFRMSMASGKTFDVRHPEMVRVG